MEDKYILVIALLLCGTFLTGLCIFTGQSPEMTNSIATAFFGGSGILVVWFALHKPAEAEETHHEDAQA